MPAAFSQAELLLFKELNTHGVRFLIVGLSSAALQGAPIVTEDIDVWIDGLGSAQFIEAVTAAGGFYVPPGIAGMNPPMIGPQSLRLIDLVTHMHGLKSFDEEYQNGHDLIVDSIPIKILTLGRIIASKEAAGRDKDKAVLPVLKSLLK